MKVPFPSGEYLKRIEIQTDTVDLEFGPRKKIALLFICLNDRYWPYVAQVIKDCKEHFLPQHYVDYFVWTDCTEERRRKQLGSLSLLFEAYKKAEPAQKQDKMNQVLNTFAGILRLYDRFYTAQIQSALVELQKFGIQFKVSGQQYVIESVKALTDKDVEAFYEIARHILMLSHFDLVEALKGTTVIEAEPAEWPAPTLLRYNLFLGEEEKIKDYEHIFYLDCDMRVVAKISDEIISDGLMAAPHPGYALAARFVPPLEPNPESTAYIPRLGQYIEENGKKRFMPFYAAGGFQGGKADVFLAAMRTMKENIDKDFDKNYIAIWNDETHWNKYLWDFQKSGGHITFLDPSYVYPDSLIKEYYEPMWGRSYEPKIITLTKPFTLSAQGAQEVNKFLQK